MTKYFYQSYIFFCKSKIHTVRNGRIIFKHVDDGTMLITCMKYFEYITSPKWAFTRSYSTIVTLGKGLRTVQS